MRFECVASYTFRAFGSSFFAYNGTWSRSHVLVVPELIGHKPQQLKSQVPQSSAEVLIARFMHVSGKDGVAASSEKTDIMRDVEAGCHDFRASARNLPQPLVVPDDTINAEEDTKRTQSRVKKYALICSIFLLLFFYVKSSIERYASIRNACTVLQSCTSVYHWRCVNSLCGRVM